MQVFSGARVSLGCLAVNPWFRVPESRLGAAVCRRTPERAEAAGLGPVAERLRVHIAESGSRNGREIPAKGRASGRVPGTSPVTLLSVSPWARSLSRFSISAQRQELSWV